jgi:hypothetical protein
MKHQNCLGMSPGPGHYDSHLPAIRAAEKVARARAPVLKGRQLPFAMPPPYNYNCQPDLCQRYLKISRRQIPLESLKRKSSVDQIFGGKAPHSGHNMMDLNHVFNERSYFEEGQDVY